MDIRVNQTQLVNQVERKEAVAPSDGSFKFVLVSNIEEQQLQTRLNALIEEIGSQSERIKKRRDVVDMRRYRELIKEFMNEVVTHSHKFSRQNFLDRRGRHRVYGIIKLIDQNLDELAGELIKDEQDVIAILNKIDEIRGLLLDLLV